MPGELCDGTTLRTANVKDSKAMCEGALARTLSTTPTNPHAAGSDAAVAFAAGVAVKADADGDPACCAPAGDAAA